MKKIRIFIMEAHLDTVTRIIGSLGILHPTEKKIEKQSSSGEEAKKLKSALMRINTVANILGITEKENYSHKTSGSSEKKSFDLSTVENKVAKLERLTIEKSSKLNELKKEISELGPDTGFIEKSGSFYIASGIIENKKFEAIREKIEELTEGEYILKKGEKTDFRIQAAFITLKKYKDSVDVVLKNVEKTPSFFTTEDLSKEIKRIKKIKSEIFEISSYLEKVKKENSEEITRTIGMLTTEIRISDFISTLEHTKKVYVLEGWIPAKKINFLRDILEKRTERKFHMEILKPEEDENIPIKFDNPNALKPFETLTEMFGLPSYNEIDPTSFLAVTFPLIFGLMFGDVGGGAVLFLGGLFSIFYLGKKNKIYGVLGRIILLCGICSTFFGFMYGSIFGYEEVIPHMWMNPKSNGMLLLTISLMIGIAQMTFGMLLDILNKVLNRKFIDVMIPVAKLWLLLGAVFLVMSYGVNFMDWFKHLFELILVFIPPLLTILLSEPLKELLTYKRVPMKKLIALLGQGSFEIFDISMKLFANTLSYGRIFALIMIHVGMSMMVISIADMLSNVGGVIIGQILRILTVVVGVAALIALETVIVFIHTTRLHYYEWFDKFYKGSGSRYDPFKISL